jgi:hypothetical protein
MGGSICLGCGFWSCPGEFVEADGYGLAEVHGGLGVGGFDDHEGVAPGEIVAGQAVLFRAEEEGNAADGGLSGEGLFDQPAGFGQIENRLLGFAAVERAGAEDEGAVGDGFGEGLVDFGVAEQAGRADGGLGLHPIDGEGSDDAEALEAEVGHGAGGCADVHGIAWGDEDYVNAVALGGSQQGSILNRMCLMADHLLLSERSAKGLLGIGYVALVAGGVDEGVGFAGSETGGFGEHVVVAAVRAEEDVAGQGFEGVELLLEVGGHLRIFGIVDQVVAGEDIGAADNDGVVALAVFVRDESEGGAAPGVACGLAGYERGAAEFDRVAVVEDASYFGGGVKHGFLMAEGKVCAASGLDVGDVGVHDHVFSAGFALDAGAAGAVVEVGVVDEENPDVVIVKAELLYTGANLGRGGGEVAVDENVALWRGDEETGEIAAADVVEIGGDAAGRNDRGPVRVNAGLQGR